jgi:hypothetical protein
VQITETETNTFSVLWKVPASMPGGALPYPTLPNDLNVGVEIGQVLFVLLLLVGFFALRAAYLRVSQAAEAGELHWSGLTTPASFVIGSVASYWMIARIAGFWV